MKRSYRRAHQRRRGVRRALAVAVAPVLAAGLLTGCGGASGPPILTWYAMPDNGGAATRAQQCADASGGAYRVSVEVLPNNATGQREQLVRRLAAGDTSIDVISVDVVYTAEFANAGFLRPYTDEETARLTNGMLPAPVRSRPGCGRTSSTPHRSSPTRSCSGTASRWPEPRASIPPA